MRHEEYAGTETPFRFNINLVRTNRSPFPDMNWHEGIEIQLCNEGRGRVFVDGAEHSLDTERAIVINSNSIHYTLPDGRLDYSALILNPDFCRKAGFDFGEMDFDTVVQDADILVLLKDLQNICTDGNISYPEARKTLLILKILLALSENHCKHCSGIRTKGRSFGYVRAAIAFIRENYNTKILLDDIAGAVSVDKYFLSRAFKEKTGKTIVEYINTYRCNQAANLILSGCCVSEAASACGFDNFSYFTKTFKRIVGTLPSKMDGREGFHL